MKRKFIEEQLVEAGKERALFWGWTNIYTYTKSIGEQVLARSGVPFTIVRPAVIESCVVFPFPGWNEGINTSAPFLYMASKGQVQFPGDHDVHLDIIPVDMVDERDDRVARRAPRGHAQARLPVRHHRHERRAG